MSDTAMKVAGALQGKSKRFITSSTLLALTLGLSAAGVASPTVKRVLPSELGGKSAPAKTAKHHWFQIGKASWYGPGFDGRATASGETYDMYAMTCAHRTLPLGSWVRVTNLINKKSVFLRVNDRGPVAPSLIMDLSYAAGRRLGISGLGKVKIEVIPPKDSSLGQELVAQLRMQNDPSQLHLASAVEPTRSTLSLVESR
jgi:rare lipoprotein A